MFNKKNGFWDVLKSILVPAAVTVLHPLAKGAINRIIDENVIKQIDSVMHSMQQALTVSQRRSIVYLSITFLLVITNIVTSLFTQLNISIWLYYATFIPFSLAIIQFFSNYFTLTHSSNGDKINSYARAFNAQPSYSYTSVKEIMNFANGRLSARYLTNPLSIACTGFALTVIDQIYQQEKMIHLAHQIGQTLYLVDSKTELEQRIVKDNKDKIVHFIGFVVKFSIFFILIFICNFLLKFYLSLNESPFIMLPPLVINTILMSYGVVMTCKAYCQPQKYQQPSYLIFNLLAGSIRFLKKR